MTPILDRIGVNWHVLRRVMADYPILIFDDLACEDFAERDNTEDPTDHYSVSPLEEATEHHVAQIVIPGCYDSGNHDTGYVTGFIQHTNIAVVKLYSVTIW
eukprot:Em0004g444a